MQVTKPSGFEKSLFSSSAPDSNSSKSALTGHALQKVRFTISNRPRPSLSVFDWGFQMWKPSNLRSSIVLFMGTWLCLRAPYCGGRMHPTRVPVVNATVRIARPSTSSPQLCECLRDTSQIFLTFSHVSTQYSRRGLVRLTRLMPIGVRSPRESCCGMLKNSRIFSLVEHIETRFS